VSNVPYVSDEAKACARMAVRAMDRYPIADDALMALPEDMDAAALSSEKGEGAEGEAERRA
jgi:nucleoid-associated protein YgaU